MDKNIYTRQKKDIRQEITSLLDFSTGMNMTVMKTILKHLFTRPVCCTATLEAFTDDAHYQFLRETNIRRTNCTVSSCLGKLDTSPCKICGTTVCNSKALSCFKMSCIQKVSNVQLIQQRLYAMLHFCLLHDAKHLYKKKTYLKHQLNIMSKSTSFLLLRYFSVVLKTLFVLHVLGFGFHLTEITCLLCEHLRNTSSEGQYFYGSAFHLWVQSHNPILDDTIQRCVTVFMKMSSLFNNALHIRNDRQITFLSLEHKVVSKLDMTNPYNRISMVLLDRINKKIYSSSNVVDITTIPPIITFIRIISILIKKQHWGYINKFNTFTMSQFMVNHTRLKQQFQFLDEVNIEYFDVCMIHRLFGIELKPFNVCISKHNLTQILGTSQLCKISELPVLLYLSIDQKAHEMAKIAQTIRLIRTDNMFTKVTANNKELIHEAYNKVMSKLNNEDHRTWYQILKWFVALTKTEYYHDVFVEQRKETIDTNQYFLMILRCVLEASKVCSYVYLSEKLTHLFHKNKNIPVGDLLFYNANRQQTRAFGVFVDAMSLICSFKKPPFNYAPVEMTVGDNFNPSTVACVIETFCNSIKTVTDCNKFYRFIAEELEQTQHTKTSSSGNSLSILLRYLQKIKKPICSDYVENFNLSSCKVCRVYSPSPKTSCCTIPYINLTPKSEKVNSGDYSRLRGCLYGSYIGGDDACNQALELALHLSLTIIENENVETSHIAQAYAEWWNDNETEVKEKSLNLLTKAPSVSELHDYSLRDHNFTTVLDANVSAIRCVSALVFDFFDESLLNSTNHRMSSPKRYNQLWKLVKKDASLTHSSEHVFVINTCYCIVIDYLFRFPNDPDRQTNSVNCVKDWLKDVSENSKKSVSVVKLSLLKVLDQCKTYNIYGNVNSFNKMHTMEHNKMKNAIRVTFAVVFSSLQSAEKITSFDEGLARIPQIMNVLDGSVNISKNKTHQINVTRCILGAILGALYGFDNIPVYLRNTVHRKKQNTIYNVQTHWNVVSKYIKFGVYPSLVDNTLLYYQKKMENPSLFVSYDLQVSNILLERLGEKEGGEDKSIIKFLRNNAQVELNVLNVDEQPKLYEVSSSGDKRLVKRIRYFHPVVLPDTITLPLSEKLQKILIVDDKLT